MLFAITGVDVPDGLEKRKATRDKHLAHLRGLGDRLVLAGPFLNEAGDPTGSLVIVVADSAEAARRLADADPYVAAGVFASVMVQRWNWTLNRPEDLKE